MPKHKHHDLIVEWAKGAEIQCRAPGGCDWGDCIGNIPRWNLAIEYRVKPTPKIHKYRVARIECITDVIQTITVDSSEEAEDLIVDRRFVEWLGDWQEVVVG